MKLLENVDRRVLAALSFVDVTTRVPITDRLALTAEAVRFVRNRSGHYVALHAEGLEHHTTSFDEAPGAPPLGSLSFDIDVADPSGRYLPRRYVLTLPRSADPQLSDEADSLFRPVAIDMFPAPAAPTEGPWSVLHVTVVNASTALPIPAALLRVTRQDDDVLIGRGMSEWRGRVRGEALVATSGVPITTFGNGDSGSPVIVTEIAATLEAVVDPTFDGLDDASVPDPDELEANRLSLNRAQVTVQLASGRRTPVSIEVAL